MKIRFMSDLHIEFGGQSGPFSNFTIPIHKDDSETVLLLAGDTGLAKHAWTLKKVFDQVNRFKQVFICIGNHEHYHFNFDKTEDTISKLVKSYRNISLLENTYAVVDNVAIIGATLWTDFNNRDLYARQNAERRMNDYQIIAKNTRTLTTNDTIDIHFKSRQFIFDAIKFHREEGRKVVVMTHMGPSFKSTHPKYMSGAHQLLNPAYNSNLEQEILETQPDYWIHGHVHTSFDYKIGETQVLTNPRGYVGQELNPDFDADKSFVC